MSTMSDLHAGATLAANGDDVALDKALQAIDAALWREHVPSDIERLAQDGGRTLLRVTCTACGMDADVDTVPAANGIVLGGDLLALTCDRNDARLLASAVLKWARTPGNHGGNPYAHEFVGLALDVLDRNAAA